MRKVNNQYLKDAVLAGGIVLGLWSAFHSVDLFEYAFEFSRAHEAWQLDEILLAFPIGVLALTWFTFRRMQDLRVSNEKIVQMNSELQKSNDAIVALSKSKEEFVAIAYHELVGTITTVSNALQLIDAAAPDEKLKRSIENAKLLSLGLNQTCADTLSVVRFLLDDAKGRAELYDLRKEVENAVATARFKSEIKGLDFTLDFDSELPEAHRGHPGILRHIIQNLVENGVKYTEKGSVRVYCGNCEDEDGAMVVRVTDTGKGIPRSAQATIFHPYKKGDVSDSSGGVGLGLYIVKRLVDGVGGRISIQENAPVGTVFTVVVPLS